MQRPATIRPATSADLDAIVAIEQTCFAEEAFPRRVLRHLVTQAQGVTLAAVYGDTVAGYISLLLRRNTCNVRIYSVAVDSTCRGHGIANLLIQKTLEFARRHGRTAVTLEVRHDNATAIALYEKFGFRRTQQLPGYYHNGADGWRMTLTLSRDFPE